MSWHRHRTPWPYFQIESGDLITLIGESAFRTRASVTQIRCRDCSGKEIWFDPALRMEHQCCHWPIVLQHNTFHVKDQHRIFHERIVVTECQCSCCHVILWDIERRILQLPSIRYVRLLTFGRRYILASHCRN